MEPKAKSSQQSKHTCDGKHHHHDHAHCTHDHAPTQSLDEYVREQEQRSKDELFVRLAIVSQAMIDAHGRDFAMGALILSARFIAEGKPLIKPQPGGVRAQAAEAS
jgi:hypothetical protein